MPVPTNEPVWWGSLLWLVAVAGVAFLIAWATGTRLHIRRSRYIPILFVVTAGLSAGYIAWLGASFADVLTTHWAWGLLAGVIAPVLLYRPVQHQPVTRAVPRGGQLRRELFWEGGVYGAAEGVLLSALPAFIAWQMAHSLGWTGAGGAVARWSLSLVAAAVVVVVHHLGYWNCRNRILVPITLGLSVLTVAFLVTGSWIAPALGHIFMHIEATLHGVEMPPVQRPVADVDVPERRELVGASGPR